MTAFQEVYKHLLSMKGWAWCSPTRVLSILHTVTLISQQFSSFYRQSQHRMECYDLFHMHQLQEPES